MAVTPEAPNRSKFGREREVLSTVWLIIHETVLTTNVEASWADCQK